MPDETVGPLLALLSLLGLIMASGVEGRAVLRRRIAFFLFGVLFIFGLIRT